MSHTAETDYPVMNELAIRRSPRAFDPEVELSDAQIGSLLEAARWSPSSSNTQPWSLYVARRGTPLFDSVLAALATGNQEWAINASVLIVNVARMVTAEGKPEKWAAYDVGQAAAHLSIQATHMGLIVHQMGGFDADQMASVLGLDDHHRAWAVLAVGEHGNPEILSEKLQERDNAPRVRKPLDEVAPGWRS